MTFKTLDGPIFDSLWFVLKKKVLQLNKKMRSQLSK
jgi:hypothetical protein